MAMVGLLACVAALGGSAVVQGAGGPNVTQAPTILGTYRVGQTLTASGGKWSGPNGTTASYQWLRCTDPSDVYSCSMLSSSTSSTYRLVNEDLNKRMRVALVARDRDNHYDYEISESVGPVAAAAPAPTPTPAPPRPTPTATPPRPTPTPRPTVTPGPAPAATPAPAPAAEEPTFDVAATPVATPVPTQGEVLHQTATSKTAKMLRPFPTVRVRGRLTPGGANVTSLTVKAPAGVRITVTCAGSGCPARKVARNSKVTRLSTFERELRAGTRLTIAISKSGYVAKVTVLRFRLGAAPLRSDGCLYPGHRKTQRCPGD
jgi:pyruvate/2-oxoglutarate dehydrogenase complex dihydrolipoamide acyltransferase (E2) component